MIKEEIMLKIDDYNKSIEEKLAHFINGCYLLKDSSNGNYQVQKTITENKIYFQGYILDSKLCQKFKENNIKDYSLANLKDYISKHFNDLDTDYTPYYQALSLYEEATNLEDLIDKKINLEIDFIYNLVKEIEILKEYMPEPLSIEKVKEIIDAAFDKIKPTSPKQMGLIMKEVTPQVKGKFDMGEVSKIIKEKLSSN